MYLVKEKQIQMQNHEILIFKKKTRTDIQIAKQF